MSGTAGGGTARRVRPPVRRADHPAGGAVGFVVRWLVALAVLQLVLLAGLVAAQAVPNGPIVRHLVEAVASGDYGPSYVSDGMGGRSDKFTECVLLGFGVSSADDDRGLWFRATGGPRLEACDDGVAQIEALAAGESVIPPATYYRYWSGYSVLTRPVLAVLGVPGLRLVSAGLLLAATLALWATTRRRLGTGPALALVLPVAVASNAVAMPALGFSHALALAAIAAGAALTAVTTSSRRSPGWRGAALGAGGAAALLNYVDLLTTPAMSWALCACIAGAVTHRSSASPGTGEVRGRRRGPAGVRPVLESLLAAGVAWPVAYGVTWVSRWVIAAAVQGPGVFTSIGDKSAERLDGASDLVVARLGAPTLANARLWWSTTATAGPLLVVTAVVVVVALVVAVRRTGPGALLLAAVLAAPALVVPAWYEALSNHSQIHAFFTYRSIPAAVGVVVAACLVAASRPDGGSVR